MKLLIAEDEEILAKVLREKFEKEKFTVVIVADGDAVIREVKSSKPDMILLDIILPKKDGLAILKELKASPETDKIPVIILSNLGDDEKIKEGLSLGADDYLVKTQHPINEVVEKVKELQLKGK